MPTSEGNSHKQKKIRQTRKEHWDKKIKGF